MTIQTLNHTLACSYKEYNLDELCSMRCTWTFCTTYCHIWEKNCGKYALWRFHEFYHMPRIYLSIYRSCLLLIFLQGTWVSIIRIITIIKGSCICLYQNYAPTGIVKVRPTILYNLIHHLYGNSIRIIRTWVSEGFLWITCSNSYIDMSPE